MTTGFAGTSRSKRRTASTWSSPASVGWLAATRWCCETEEVGPPQHYIWMSSTTVLLTFVTLTVCSASTTARQDQRGQAAQAEGAGAPEEDLQAGSSHFDDDDEPLPVDQSALSVNRWKEWQPGFPMSIDANRHKDLPRDIQFDSEKGVDFVLNYTKA